MLSSEEQELLTGYVDGELSARQRRIVARLLRRSAEARTLLRDLQGDSRELQAMPSLGAPVDFAPLVLQRIEVAPRPVLRMPRRVVPAPVRFPLYRGFAAAAAVLLFIGMGSFFLHRSDRPTLDSGDNLARQGDRIDDEHASQLPKPEFVKKPTPPIVEELLVANHPPKPTETPKPNDEEDDDKPIVVVTPDPDRPDGPILTAPGRESRGVLERVELVLPTFHKLHTLDRPEQSRSLVQELTGPAYRVELTARDATRGFVRLQEVFAARKINLVFDPATASRIKKHQRRTDIGLFIENISPADLVAILTAVGTADRLGADLKPSEMRFDGSLIVKELSAWDRRAITDFLSIDPVKNRPATSARPAVDIRRPLDEQTADQVAASLQGKGVPRPGSTAMNLSAYVSMLSGPRDRSLDLTLFLASRLPARPGSLQVFLVLRNVAP